MSGSCSSGASSAGSGANHRERERLGARRLVQVRAQARQDVGEVGIRPDVVGGEAAPGAPEAAEIAEEHIEWRRFVDLPCQRAVEDRRALEWRERRCCLLGRVLEGCGGDDQDPSSEPDSTAGGAGASRSVSSTVGGSVFTTSDAHSATGSSSESAYT